MRLTTSPPSCAECHEIWEPKPPETLWATLGLLRDCFTFTYPYRLGNSNVLAFHGGVESYSVQENTRIKVFIFIMEQQQEPKVSVDVESRVWCLFLSSSPW